MSKAVSNTSPLTNLAVIGCLNLVRTQFDHVDIPQAVWDEMIALPHDSGRAALIDAREKGWLTVRLPGDTTLAETLRLSGLDEGEAHAIALAVETNAPWLLIDERKGRRVARHLGLPITGALGIVAAAKRAGTITSASEIITRLRTEAGFFVSAEAEAMTRRIAGET